MSGATVAPARPPTDRTRPPSPYKGLTPFTEEDVDFFFGREQETEIIRANLLAARLTLLYGESGVGKSSVLHAGAAHRLRREARRNLEETGRPEHAVIVLRAWRDDPVAALLREVEGAVTGLVGREGVEIPAGAGLAEALAVWAERLDGDLLVILDQFEEYFLYHGTERGPGSFAYEFPRGVNRLDLRASFLVSIREDALAKLDVFKGSIPALFDNRLRIDHLSRENARAAIEGPVRAYNERVGDAEACAVEPELVEDVLAEIGGAAVSLGQVGAGETNGAGAASREGRIQAPYLQLVLTRIWEEELSEGSRVLRAATLRRCGGAETIVRTRLDEAMASLSPAERDVAARVFHYLVTRSGAKVAHTAADLASYAELPEPAVTGVVRHMAGGDVRILRPVPPPPGSGGATRYEIFHDVIGPAVLDWRARHTEAATRREAEGRARRERRKTRIWAVVALLSLAACAAVAVLAIWAVDQKRAAQAERQTARAHSLAAQASLELGGDPARSAALALEALELRETPAARRVLIESLADLRTTHIVPGVVDESEAAEASSNPRRPYLLLPGGKGVVRVVDATTGGEVSVLRGHRGEVVTTAFSPDAGRAVTLDWNERARVWDTTTGELLHVLPPRAAASVAVGPKGRVAVGTYGGRITLWDARSGRRLAQRTRPGAPLVDGLAFSSDGRRLATYDVGIGSANLWDVSRGDLSLVGPIRTSGGVDAWVHVALSADGRQILTVGTNGDVRLWDADTLSLTRTLASTSSYVPPEFSADGNLVAAVEETTVSVWRTDTGRVVSEMRRDVDTVRDIAFRGDGRALAIAYDDGAARVWDVSSGHELLELRGHSGPIFLAAFLGGGRSRLATVGEDGTARTWSVDTGKELRGHGGAVLDVAFSPRGDRIATIGEDGNLRTWDGLTGGKLAATVVQGWPVSVAFSRDGTEILTAESTSSGTSSAAVRSAESLEPKATFGDRPDDQSAVGTAAFIGPAFAARSATLAAFSPDGTRVAAVVGLDGNSVRVWDRATKKELVALKRDHRSEPVTEIAYSADGARIAILDDAADVVEIWDARSGRRLRRVDVHLGRVNGVSPHPGDPDLVVTAGVDRSAVVWSARTGRPVVTLPHAEAVTAVSFSANGRRVVTGDSTGSLRIWEWRTGTLLGSMRAHGDEVTAAFSPGGRVVLSAGRDRVAKLSNCRTCVPLAEVRREAEAHLRELRPARG